MQPVNLSKVRMQHVERENKYATTCARSSDARRATSWRRAAAVWRRPTIRRARQPYKATQPPIRRDIARSKGRVRGECRGARKEGSEDGGASDEVLAAEATLTAAEGTMATYAPTPNQLRAEATEAERLASENGDPAKSMAVKKTAATVEHVSCQAWWRVRLRCGRGADDRSSLRCTSRRMAVVVPLREQRRNHRQNAHYRVPTT